MSDVTIVRLGSGNIGSINQAVRRLGHVPVVSDDPSVILASNRLILPGVGNFGAAMDELEQSGLEFVIREFVSDSSNRMMGICLGMQLLAEWGTETPDGTTRRGLGFIEGTVRSLRDLGCNLRTPHVGWNELDPGPSWAGLFDGVPARTDAYFVHNFVLESLDPSIVAATTNHGIEFVSAIRQSNVWATQFHPEKSSSAGLAIVRNFMESE